MANMITRKEIGSLTGDELARLRAAFAQLQAQAGAGGYQDLAGYHGVPRGLCPHGSPLFLPWHRAYILAFENALRRFDPSVHLPFWDWTSAGSAARGIPPALADPQYRNAAGQLVANPLFSATISSEGRATRRSPGNPVRLESYARSVDLANRQGTYLGFNGDLEGPHGSLHIWVSGDMRTPAFAAYDPIFWMHHANVDRQWAAWQRSPRNAAPRPTSCRGGCPASTG